MHTPRDQHKVYSECLRISVNHQVLSSWAISTSRRQKYGAHTRMSSAWNWLIEGFNFMLQALAT